MNKTDSTGLRIYYEVVSNGNTICEYETEDGSRALRGCFGPGAAFAGFEPRYPSPPGTFCTDFRNDPQPALTWATQGWVWCTPEPNIPAGAPYSASQMDALRNGFATAWHHIFGTCVETFIKGGLTETFGTADALAEVLGTLANTQYRIVPFDRGGALATMAPNSVFINTMGAFFWPPSGDGLITFGLPASGANITLAAGSARALLLLHELGHQVGVLFTPDADNAIANEANTRRILQQCFVQDRNGVWY